MSGKRKGKETTDKEPKKPRFYVDDGVAEHEISRASYPCLIMDPGHMDHIIGRLEPVSNELQARLTIQTSEHISSLTVRVVSEYENGVGEKKNYSAMIRLSANAVGEMELIALTDEELAKLTWLKSKQEGDIFYTLQVREISSALICSERLFCDNVDAPRVKEVADLFRNMTDLLLFVEGSEQTAIDFEALQNQFISERAEDKILAWHKNHPHKVMAQLGMFLEPNDRPNPSHYDAKTSFYTWWEYLTVMPHSLLQEQEVIDEMFVDLKGATLDLRAMTLPKSADRRYLGFLFLTPGTSLRFSNGDRLKVNFEPEDDLREEDWSAFVVDPVSWAPLNSVTILLTRPFDKQEEGDGTWREGTPFDAADFNLMRNDTQARQILAQTSCAQVIIRVATSNQVFKNCLTAIQKINEEGTPNLKGWFLGSRMDELEKIDFYESLRANLGDNLESELLHLQGAQLTAALGLKSLRYGKQFVQGPPGTGKTYYAKEITKPFLLDDSKVHQGIMCSTTNEGVDELALGMNQLVEEVTPEGKTKPMVIRFHSLATEEEVGLLDAKKARGKPADARPSIIDAELDVDVLNECVFLNNLFEHIRSATTCTEPLINDPRLKLLQLSLGIRMLQVGGMPGFECEYSEPEKFATVREFYRQFKSNMNMSREDMIDFKKSMKELRSYTLSPAKATVKVTIVVSTVANVASTTLYGNVTEAEWFILDEVPRITEPMLWPVFAHYPTARCHVFVGDPAQLPPQLESHRGNNCFAKQLEVSLFSRFVHGGHLHYFFNEQHRAVDPLSKIVSAVFYEGKLTNGPNTGIDHESREIARQIQDYNQEKYTKKSSAIFLDNKDGIAKQNDVSKSTYNISNCAVGMNLAVDLVKRGFDPSKITLLSPYNAQRRYYQCAVDRADTIHPKLGLRKIKVAVIDGYQGKENHIIILDWTVVENLGFLKEFGRLCVAHSRARDALYIIGNKDEIEKNQKSDMRVFKRLLGRAGVGTLKFSLEETQTSEFVSEDMVDAAMDVDMGGLLIEEGTDADAGGWGAGAGNWNAGAGAGDWNASAGAGDWGTATGGTDGTATAVPIKADSSEDDDNADGNEDDDMADGNGDNDNADGNEDDDNANGNGDDDNVDGDGDDDNADGNGDDDMADGNGDDDMAGGNEDEEG